MNNPEILKAYIARSCANLEKRHTVRPPNHVKVNGVSAPDFIVHVSRQTMNHRVGTKPHTLLSLRDRRSARRKRTMRLRKLRGWS